MKQPESQEWPLVSMRRSFGHTEQSTASSDDAFQVRSHRIFGFVANFECLNSC